MHVLQEYAKLLTTPVQVLPDMELVKHESDESHIKKDNCICHNFEVKLNLLFSVMHCFVILESQAHRSVIHYINHMRMFY